MERSRSAGAAGRPGTVYVAFLRAVNVGGTGTLAMADLAQLCRDLGFAGVRTYIASGNVLFRAAGTEREVKRALEAALARLVGKSVGVLVRTAAEIAAVSQANPFPDAPAARTVVLFLDRPPPPGALDEATGRRDEIVALGRREVYVHYPAGIASSKLRIPAAAAATGRNMNTVAKLAALAAEL